ncbi:hypothetical protein [Absidia glauca]|uniref:Uncharacterized protein n=1 Tax=Absidia glauca TaxID=4829 RepID=A0A163JEJ7_ABSGL|nr:hypothetical protein [Absidia glauca]
MTLGFAESMPENADTVYHVEWLDSQQAFPSLSSVTDQPQQHGEWQFLHRQEIQQAQEDMTGGKRLKTSEMEDKWQQVDFLHEKQFVDVAVEATHLPEGTKVPPAKPQRQQQQQQQQQQLTEEQERLLYWEMIDNMDEEEADFYDLYYDRKTQGINGNKNRLKHFRRHIEALHRLHNRFEQGEMWDNTKIQKYLEHMASLNDMDQLNSTPGAKQWGPAPSLDPRLLHGLVHVAIPRNLDRYWAASHGTSGSKVVKSSIEPDFCLQAKQ